MSARVATIWAGATTVAPVTWPLKIVRSTTRTPISANAMTQIPAATTMRLWIVVGTFAAIWSVSVRHHEMKIGTGLLRRGHARVLHWIAVQRRRLAAAR